MVNIHDLIRIEKLDLFSVNICICICMLLYVALNYKPVVVNLQHVGQIQPVELPKPAHDLIPNCESRSVLWQIQLVILL